MPEQRGHVEVSRGLTYTHKVLVANDLLARPKLGHEVTRHLRDWLMSGALVPGQRLTVDDLAGQLGVSAMPVREALVALENEGLVEALPRRGFRVVELRERDVQDLFRVHAFVAGLLAEDAAQHITTQTLVTLKGLQQRIDDLASRRKPRPQDATEIETLNYQFHRVINHQADARRLRWLLRAATRFIPRNFYESIPGWTNATVSEHPEIIDALERRDPKAARELMAAHVVHAGELVIPQLARRGLWSGRPGETTVERPTVPATGGTRRYAPRAHPVRTQ